MNDDLIDRAMKAYFRRFGDNAQQPSRDCSHVTHKAVELRNTYDVLATYRVSKNGGLRFLSPERVAEEAKHHEKVFAYLLRHAARQRGLMLAEDQIHAAAHELAEQSSNGVNAR